jgi:uncharacterized protein (TIGR02466 family)
MLYKIFPTLIHEEMLLDFEKHNDYLINKAYELKNKLSDEVKTDWRCDTFNTLDAYDHSQEKDPIIEELINTCRVKTIELAKEYGVTRTDLTCVDFWFNISQPGNYQEYHQHANCHFSLTYYLKTPKDCGNIVFKSTDAITDMYPLPVDYYTYSSFKTFTFEPKENLLLIFRNNLLHMVEKNMSSEDRVGITMNFSYKI